MPLYRYNCKKCGIEFVDLRGFSEANPTCCGVETTKLMPRRVVGRVVPDSNGVHSGSGFSRVSANAHASGVVSRLHAEGRELDMVADGPASEAIRPTTNYSTPIDPDDPTMIPLPSYTGEFAKDFDDCSRAEKDSRWRDTAAATAAWHTKLLEQNGVDSSEARSIASQAAQQTVAKAQAESVCASGLT